MWHSRCGSAVASKAKGVVNSLVADDSIVSVIGLQLCNLLCKYRDSALTESPLSA